MYPCPQWDMRRVKRVLLRALWCATPPDTHITVTSNARFFNVTQLAYVTAGLRCASTVVLHYQAAHALR